ncbi:hypothetical protein M527_11325 [Sphingobium indicum IP26]|nr:hypothetical protein M527_11325 [Sphingobium indicum IP26]
MSKGQEVALRLFGVASFQAENQFPLFRAMF